MKIKARCSFPEVLMDKLLRNKRTILCFLLPGVVIYTVSVIIPIIWSAYYSLVDWNGYGEITYVGINNFKRLMGDTEFWDSVVHTLIYAIGQIVLQIGGGLLLAVLLTNIVVLRKPLQVMYYLPVIISTVALCQMFKKMFGVVPAGLVNQILSNFNPKWGHIEWLTNVKSSLAMVTAVAGYKNMSVYMLIFYSAFLTVPNSLVEAAKIDGANSFQIFTKIKIPHIRPTIFANLLLVLNGSLRGFDIAKLLTAGGPINSSQLQAMYMYKQAFSSQKYGYGSTVAMFIVTESLILAILIRWISSSRKLGGR